MKLIAAIDENWNIGKDGGLLVHIPQDMKFFREKTLGKIVVMGRKTLESFPGKKPLKGRTNIVLTTDRDYQAEGPVTLVHSVEELIGVLSDYEQNDIFVIGGGSIYRQLLPFCDTAYITKVHVCCEADTTFPNLDEAPDWKLRYIRKGGIHEGMEYQFCTYLRRRSSSQYRI
ncbi:MAG: dihydrofolate reductase [Parasporobacterium sp.]|nr:dihydrofolate reductase [Parasporobacterium sp.]